MRTMWDQGKRDSDGSSCLRDKYGPIGPPPDWLGEEGTVREALFVQDEVLPHPWLFGQLRHFYLMPMKKALEHKVKMNSFLNTPMLKRCRLWDTISICYSMYLPVQGISFVLVEQDRHLLIFSVTAWKQLPCDTTKCVFLWMSFNVPPTHPPRMEI